MTGFPISPANWQQLVRDAEPTWCRAHHAHDYCEEAVLAPLQAEAHAGLDAAWAEVEAALPKGWDLWWVANDPHHGNPAGPWNAVAGLRAPEDPTLEQVRSNKQAYGPTPAAALRALAAALAAEDPELVWTDARP